MNRHQLYDLISNPSLLDEKSLAGLQELTARYPFFQAGRMLLLKNLYLLDNLLYEPELKKSAAYISDRTRLFELIEGMYPEKQQIEETGGREDIVEETKEQKEKKEERPSSVAVTGKVGSVSDYFGVDDVTETIQGGKVGFSFNSGEEGKDENVPEELLFDYEKSDGAADYSLSIYDEGSEEEAVKEGSYSFEDWLSFVSSNRPGKQAEAEVKSKPEKNKTLDVIDRFLNNQDKSIKPQADAGNEGKSPVKEPTAFDSDELMSETLAKIYVKQGHYSKALKIFEKLSLKYPEKSVYFAQQIEKVEKLISNQ